MNVSTSWVRFKDSLQKAVLLEEVWRRSSSQLVDYYNDYTGDLAVNSSVGSHDTCDNHSDIHQAHLLRAPTEEEEIMQLRRLTSWGTDGTYDETVGETISGGPTVRMDSQTKLVAEDDDGVPIDIKLLRGKKLHVSSTRANAAKEPRKKRVVTFDYPPISSLRECPRTQPEQIEELFFTEHELEQIEHDRYSTISADDVEIVAISVDEKKNSSRRSANAGHQNQDGSPSTTAGSSHRMIKSVQIYLRDRSIG